MSCRFAGAARGTFSRFQTEKNTVPWAGDILTQMPLPSPSLSALSHLQNRNPREGRAFIRTRSKLFLDWQTQNKELSRHLSSHIQSVMFIMEQGMPMKKQCLWGLNSFLPHVGSSPVLLPTWKRDEHHEGPLAALAAGWLGKTRIQSPQRSCPESVKVFRLWNISCAVFNLPVMSLDNPSGRSFPGRESLLFLKGYSSENVSLGMGWKKA